MTFGYTRRCIKCKVPKPVAGGKMVGPFRAKRFVCGGCSENNTAGHLTSNQTAGPSRDSDIHEPAGQQHDEVSA